MQGQAARTGEADPHEAGTQIGTVAAMALPLLFFIAALPGFSYWGEPGRLLDAAVTLRHGGSPIATLAAALTTRLPVGPLSLRVALSMALGAAVAAGGLFAALRLSLQRVGVQRQELRVAAAFGSTCVALGQEPLWSLVLQGNPQIFGIALCALLLHQLLRAQPEAPGGAFDTRALALGGLYLGLLTSHDPGFGLALCGAWLLSLRRVPHWPRATLLTAGLGLTPMLLSVMRGQDTTSLSGIGSEIGSGIGAETGAGVGGALLGGGGLSEAGTVGADPQTAAPMLLLWVVAALGCVGVLRRPDTRGAGLTWLAGLGAPTALGLLLRPTPMVQATALSLLGIGAVVFATLGVGLLAAGAARTERLGLWLAAAWVVLGVVQLREASMERSLAGFDTSAVLQRHAADNLPARAVLLWPQARAHADAVGFRSEHGARPDVLSVPLSRARDPQVSEAMAGEAPVLRELLRELLLRGELRVSALQSLSGQVPVAIDLPAAELPALGETLLPNGALLQVVADGTTTRDRQAAAEAQTEYYGRVYEGVDLQQLDARSRGILLGLHQRDALYYLQMGEREAARVALGAAARLQPGDARTAAMLAAAGDPEDEEARGAVDIGVFLGGAAGGGGD